MRNLGIVAKVLAAVVIGPTAMLAAALDEANKAPAHTTAAAADAA
jgi:hypothetical protein